MTWLPLVLAIGVMAACQHHTRANPSPLEDSWNFHGEPSQVRGGKMVVGELESVTYRAPASSGRAGLWEHKFGDGGVFAPSTRERPLLLEKNGRISFDAGKSPTHFVARAGIVQ